MTLITLAFALAFFLALMWASPVYAGNNTQIGNVLCTVIGWMSGNMGKGLECICICILGVGALLGKISWGTAMVEGIGAAIVFSAAQIVDAMGAGAPLGCAIS